MVTTQLHNAAVEGQIATVLMPGDPLRAKLPLVLHGYAFYYSYELL